MEANLVFEMQCNYIAFQTPVASQCIHILQIPILQDGNVFVYEPGFVKL